MSALQGENYYLIEVIALIMQELKDLLESDLAKTEHRIIEKSGEKRKVNATDFTWVITVPAIWQDKGKQMMREAAYKVIVMCMPLACISIAKNLGDIGQGAGHAWVRRTVRIRGGGLLFSGKLYIATIVVTVACIDIKYTIKSAVIAIEDMYMQLAIATV